jgi:four helix bundle protein
LTLSPLTHFNIAKGSAGEVRSLLRVALEIGYLNEPTYSQLSEQVVGISKMLFKQIESLNANL